MQITLDLLQKRRDDLSALETTLKADLDIVKDKSKLLRKEIANIKGAIIEIDRLIDSHD